MKKGIQELLEDLLDFYAYRKPGPLLQEAYDQIETTELFSKIQKILSWQSSGGLEFTEYDIFMLPINEFQQERFIAFFHACPELAQLFKPENSELRWSEKLTDKEIQDISDYLVKRAIPYFSGSNRRRRPGRLS